MTYAFEAVPAHADRPGITVLGDSVMFSCAIRPDAACGLLLYHLPELTQVRIPFEDDCRCGSLYSVRIKGLRPGEWAYRYYSGDLTFEDPLAREILPAGAKDRPVSLCGLFPLPEDALPPAGSASYPDWPRELLYCLHVKGFTASRSAGVSAGVRGTFRGIAEKIPYLKDLGVTGVELLPVCELRTRGPAGVCGEPKDATREDRARSLRVTKELADRIQIPSEQDRRANGGAFQDPDAHGQAHAAAPDTRAQDMTAEKINYWNFGEGFLFAPKRSYSASGKPQQELRQLVDTLHENGIGAYLQLYFTDSTSVQTQVETARFYVTHYGVDGFHIKGNGNGVREMASDPLLSHTALLYYGFPYEELEKAAGEDRASAGESVRHLCEYRDDFQTLSRRFVKSDDGVLRDFIRLFLDVPEGHGQIHYIANYDGFTLKDLVTYNDRHNEANGEGNLDGRTDNYSWNCGAEGPTRKKAVNSLRLRQMRNLTAINLLAQGTPLISAGDEQANSQGGNNNPYCQDNETGWTNWRNTAESRAMLRFTRQMSAFRRRHAILRRSTPFTFMDSRAVGYPDLSLHGKEAWKADLSESSHTIGIMMAEAYAQEDPADSLLYVAMNMYWAPFPLALPKPPAGQEWRILMDTSAPGDAFLPQPVTPENAGSVMVPSRTVMILQTMHLREDRSSVSAPVATVGIRARKYADLNADTDIYEERG